LAAGGFGAGVDAREAGELDTPDSGDFAMTAGDRECRGAGQRAGGLAPDLSVVTGLPLGHALDLRDGGGLHDGREIGECENAFHGEKVRLWCGWR